VNTPPAANTPPAHHLLVIAACLVLSPAARAEPDAPFANIESMVQRAIEQGDLPGAVVCFADAKNIRYLRAIGDRRVEPERVAMTTDTVFDLASITKPVATATSVAMLCQTGKLRYSDRVAEHLPAFSGHGKENITVRQCLLHTSGLIPDNALSDYDGTDAEQWQRICDLKLRTPPGEAFSYSDVGFIVLGKLVQKLGGTPLDRFATEQIFQPLRMNETMFNPTPELAARAAPTEKQGDRWLCGTVHDPRAARMDGVAGHAGLFSTADDLVVYSQHLLKALRGKSDVMKAETVRAMTAAHEVPRGTRTPGWDHQSPYSRNRGSELSDAAFGHGGFTGTVLWIDPDKELIFIFLSSRLHPDGKGSVNSLAGQIVSEVAAGWESGDQ
jgi:CubicO group peptidase (beta-lactamase class C family)